LQNKGNNSRRDKMVKSKNELGHPLMVPDLVYKFHIIHKKKTVVIEQKPYEERIDGGTEVNM
jgi:hypothetical protein